MISGLYFGGRRGVLLTSKGNIIKMGWCLDSLHFATNIEILDSTTEIRNGRMRWVICAEDLNGLLHSVRSVYIFDCTAVRNA